MWPQIQWDHNELKDVQLCRALFSDAVVRYRRMQAASSTLDKDLSQLPSFCDDDDMHTRAFEELNHYNITQTFLYIHPITSGHKETNRLEALLISSPGAFLDECTNAQKNVTRYNSLINKQKYKDEEQHNDWLNIITRENAKILLMQDLIQRK